MESYLNLGAGKIAPILKEVGNHFIVNVDKGYKAFCVGTVSNIVYSYNIWLEHKQFQSHNCPLDAFEFMENSPILFDNITIYRFLEHIERTRVLYFIYLLSMSVKRNGKIDCIVPNYELLAHKLLSEIPGGQGWEYHDILLSTEMLNEPYDPHASIWTPRRIRYFFELERRFVVDDVVEDFPFDDRSGVYLRATVRRV